MNTPETRYLTFTFNASTRENKPWLTTSEAIAYQWASIEDAERIRDQVALQCPDFPALVLEPSPNGLYRRLRTAAGPIEQSLTTDPDCPVCKELAAPKPALFSLLDFPVNARCITIQQIESYPDFIVPVGITGTITKHDDEELRFKMDVPVAGADAEDWDNSVIFNDSDLEDRRLPSDYLKVLDVCEWCPPPAMATNLHLLACSGGATGDLYACDQHWQQHLSAQLNDGMGTLPPCFECAPPRGVYQTMQYYVNHDPQKEREHGPDSTLTTIYLQGSEDTEIRLTVDELEDYARNREDWHESDTYSLPNFTDLLDYLYSEVLIERIADAPTTADIAKRRDALKAQIANGDDVPSTADITRVLDLAADQAELKRENGYYDDQQDAEGYVRDTATIEALRNFSF